MLLGHDNEETEMPTSLMRPPLPRAQFAVVKDTDDIVFIEDANAKGPSVTNDAEAVTAYVYWQFRKRIVYKDTTGNWDELVHHNGVFGRFAPYKGEAPGQ